MIIVSKGIEEEKETISLKEWKRRYKKERKKCLMYRKMEKKMC